MPLTSSIWQYFTIVDDRNRKAKCGYCDNVLSFNSTIGNLKKHLTRKHKEFHEECRISTEAESDDGDDDSKEPAATEELASSDLFRFFTKENDKCARCDLCSVTLPLQLKCLEVHLNQKHSKMVTIEEQEVEEIPNAFQEVVYLLDSDSTQKHKPKIETRRNSLPVQRERERRLKEVELKKRRLTPSPPKEPVDEEMNIFLKYVGVLMKDLPKEVNTKLQMDIIHLIMTTKISQNVKPVPATVVNGEQKETVSHHIVVSLDNAEKAESVPSIDNVENSTN